MSDAQREESSSSLDVDWPSVADSLRDWYHVPVLAAMIAAMLGIRLQTYGNFVRDGKVYFSGNDAWYHLREVQYTVRNWPATMPFDPWTNFPYGTSVGQFGTVYDQLIATAALVAGLGSPSTELVAKTLLVAPAVFGALVVIPTYLVGKRLGGRLAGLFGAAILVLLPGTFLRRGLVGFADHNVAEPLFQTFAVAALLVALAVAKRDRPIWELVEAREFDSLRRPLLWAGISGVATAVYMWVWPPGVLLVGIVGIFAFVYLTGEYVTGRSPEPVAFVLAVAMGVTSVMMLVPVNTLDFGTTRFSLLQPFLALLVALGCVFLAALARRWDDLDAPAWGYPAAAFGLVAVGFAFVWVVLPDLFALVTNNLLRTVAFSAGAATRTIGEAQPFLDPNLLDQLQMTRINRIVSEYGFTFFTGVAAAVWMMAKPLVEGNDARRLGFLAGGLAVIGLLFLIPAIPAGIGNAVGVDPQIVGAVIVGALIVGAALLASYDPEPLFVIVWAVIITAAAFTQVRFNYYLAVVVAVMNAYLFGEVLRYLGLRTPEQLSEIEGYQVLAVLAAVMLVLAPVLVVPLGVRDTGNPAADRSETAWQAAQSNGPGAVTQWDGSLTWLNNSTPPEGQFGGANNDLDYYGTYRQIDDFSYPEGAYGVISWWDYGHWITTLGQRIPNANPFQEGARSAANFLLAPNEERAAGVLAGQSTEGNRTRYVMVDWQMATPGSKFGAPIVWYDGDLSSSDMYHRVYDINDSQIQSSSLLKHQRYYDSLMVRLYSSHGSAIEPEPFVFDWENRQVETQGGEPLTIRTTPSGANESTIRQFNNMSAAREYVREDGTAQVGGFGRYPEERVPALQHYRLVKASESSALQSREYQSLLFSEARTLGIPPQALLQSSPAWVKTFERVPGATVRGSGAPANANVTARVQMRVPTTGENFTYVQRAQANDEGEFAMTLPYSTTDYDEYGPQNGYTNVSVRASGPYTLSTDGQLNDSGYVVQYGANVSVGEGLVNGAEDGAKEVTLERRAREIQVEEGNQTQTGSQNGSATNGTGDGASPDENGTAVTVGDGAGGSSGSGGGSPSDAVASPPATAEPAVASPAIRSADA